eukprot:7975234-Alexandrium_andersonii.AAC.1
MVCARSCERMCLCSGPGVSSIVVVHAHCPTMRLCTNACDGVDGPQHRKASTQAAKETERRVGLGWEAS